MPKYPSWYQKPKKDKTRKRNYLAVERFKRGKKSFVGVFKRRALQTYNGKEWVTLETERLGLKSYKPFRSFKPIARATGMGTKKWSITEGVKGYAEKIVKSNKVQMLRVRIEGIHGGKRRVLTSYVRFSPRNKNFLLRSKGPQRREYLQKLLARTALAKIRSLGYSSSPESKRNLEEGDSKKNSRFFIKSVRVDSVK